MSIIKKIHKDRQMILGFCERFDEIYLYGSGIVAQYFYDYLVDEGIFPIGIIVSSNAETVDFHGLPVCNVSEADFIGKRNAGVILALSAKQQEEIIPALLDKGFEKKIFLQRQRFYVKDGNVDESQFIPMERNKKDVYFSAFEILENIGNQLGTDKCSNCHDYLHKYEFFLNKWHDKKVTLLELGIFKGASLKMWGEYFPYGRIIGVDIDESCYRFAGENREVLISDLSQTSELIKLSVLTPDIIIDDASHSWSQQIKALTVLFPSLSSGGIYIVEDLETSFQSYKFMNYDDAEISTYKVLSALAELVTSREHLMQEHVSPSIMRMIRELEKFSVDIAMMSFIHGSCILVKR